jgi:hypothetical protein
VRKVVAFGRRHVWPVTAAAGVAVVCALCGIAVAISLMIHGPFIAGYFLGAICGDVLLYGLAVPVLLWLPRMRPGAG